MSCLSLQVMAQNQDPVLRKGQPSPYDGIILKKERYGFLRARDDIASRLETENIELSVQEQKKPFISPVSACLIGVVVGAGVIYLTSPQGNSFTSFAAGAIGGGLLVLTFE